jgi:flavin reductase (DIM6/NTAB) family NADH-FMN oxidoreductase RutF
VAEQQSVDEHVSTLLRRAFTLYPRGVMAVAARVDGATCGFAASAFVSVSLNPALMIICVDRTSTTWPVLSTAETIGVSVIAESDAWLGRQFGARGVDRFAGVALREVPGGALLLENAVAAFTTSIDQVFEGGDHLVVMLRVHDFSLDPSKLPLVWHDTQFAAVRPLGD